MMLAQQEASAVAALRSYIASFSSQSDLGLGNQPPCREYRYLLNLEEFDTQEERLSQCRSVKAIGQSKSFYKISKAAYTDLTTMAVVAEKRLARAIKTNQ